MVRPPRDLHCRDPNKAPAKFQLQPSPSCRRYHHLHTDKTLQRSPSLTQEPTLVALWRGSGGAAGTAMSPAWLCGEGLVMLLEQQ